MTSNSSRSRYIENKIMLSIVKSLWVTFKHLLFHRADTIQYPEQRPLIPARWRGRIVLSRDPDGDERCVACYLCAVVCPVDCIALQSAERKEDGRRYPEMFRINFSRCIFCGLCEEACPTYAIQLTPDFEMAEYDRNNLVYEKEDLLIDGPGKYPDYNFYRMAGIKTNVKDIGTGEKERPPVDLKDLMP
jgi:NADH-quinone oxidoreductase subunit I